MKPYLQTVALAVAFVGVLTSAPPLASQIKPVKTKHVVLIVTDGLRWQEMFTGAESALISRSPGGVADTAAVRHEFWRDTPEARRAALFPFIWSTIAHDGQVYGDPTAGSDMRTTNPLKFSYPGYNEIFTGVYDPAINSNGYKANDNVTVFEWLNTKPAMRGHVDAVATWGVFNNIFNRARAGFPIVAGWEPPFAENTPISDRQATINDLYRTMTRVWEDNAYDAPMHMVAKEVIARDHPRLLFVGYGETDEWAHLGRYDLLLQSAHRVDGFVADLWHTVQADPTMRGTTTFIITTDHGRGDGVSEWKDHGQKVAGAERLWMAVIGPDTPARGNQVQTKAVTQAQIAATVAAFFGESWQTQRADAGAVVGEILGR